MHKTLVRVDLNVLGACGYVGERSHWRGGASRVDLDCSVCPSRGTIDLLVIAIESSR